MEFCPDCGCQLIHTEGCVLCSYCGYSACGCGFCNGLGKGVEDVQSSFERELDKNDIPAEACMEKTNDRDYRAFDSAVVKNS